MRFAMLLPVLTAPLMGSVCWSAFTEGGVPQGIICVLFTALVVTVLLLAVAA